MGELWRTVIQHPVQFGQTPGALAPLPLRTPALQCRERGSGGGVRGLGPLALRIRGPFAQCHGDGLLLRAAHDRQRDMRPWLLAEDRAGEVVVAADLLAVYRDDNVAGAQSGLLRRARANAVVPEGCHEHAPV